MEIDDARGQTSELELKLCSLLLQRGIATTNELVANAKLWLSEGHSESVREVRVQQQAYSDRMEQDICNDPTPAGLPLDAFAETLVGHKEAVQITDIAAHPQAVTVKFLVQGFLFQQPVIAEFLKKARAKLLDGKTPGEVAHTPMGPIAESATPEWLIRRIHGGRAGSDMAAA